ncbi:hypothetical protein A0J61_07902, partial [Choanephora cucurbitarum]
MHHALNRLSLLFQRQHEERHVREERSKRVRGSSDGCIQMKDAQARINLNIANPATGCQKLIEIEDERR